MPKSPRRRAKGDPGGCGARRFPERAVPVLFRLCAAWLAAALICRLLAIPVGVFGTLALALISGLFGRAAPLIPAWLLLLAGARKRGDRFSLSAALLLLAAFFEGNAPSLLTAWRRGRASVGGGLLGALFSCALLLFAGAAGRWLALALLTVSYLFRLRGLIPRNAVFCIRAAGSGRGRRRSESTITVIGKDDAMLGFKKRKKPIVVDDGGYYPVGDAGESFSQVRARLEKEESAKAYLVRDEERVSFPAAPPAVTEQASEPPEALPLSRAPISDPSDGPEVVPAAAIFGRGGSFAESESFPISPIRDERFRAETVSRATDAPFARTTVPGSAYAAESRQAPASQPVYTPAPAPAAEPAYTPAPAPAKEPAYTPAPAPAKEPAYTPAPAVGIRAAGMDGAAPAESMEADSVFGSGERMVLDAARISDASLPPVTTTVVPPSTSNAALIEPSAEATPYTYPPLSLLSPSATVGGSSDEEIRQNAQSLLDTLDSFNVKASIKHVSRGPRITRYEIVPDKGIRIRAIVNLQDDISMNLAAAGIRIEAPIPGLAAVGVEVPNSRPSTVCLRDMLDNETFRSASSKTTVCVGADVTGKPVYGDIGKMPHALIAGATGMGKSVCINTILLSLLYKAHPDEVKLILVDPKKVEFAPYNGIPHLLVPVVIEPQKAAGALVWAVGEMERRFNMIEQTGVRDIKGYNRIAASNPEIGKPLPQIVIVIDELNDLMMSARDAVEDAICRIAQKARAAGIHLLIGTQRPSVDVITGVIKANIPSRMAFHVSSQVDSRTILDMTGAEKLLDKGDMLFFPVGEPKPIRVQGAYVTDEEVAAVTTFLKRGMSGAPVYDDEIMANIEREAEKCAPKDKRSDRAGDDDFDGEGGDIFGEAQFVAAVEIAIKLGQISTSKIQTKLRIGFQKASNYIEKMEELGIVGPSNGSKPRDVLITADQFLEMKARY